MVLRNKKETIKNKQTYKTPNEIEFNGLFFLKNLIKEEIDIIRCFEGCKCDFIIKPKNNNEDLWLRVQLKVASKSDLRDRYEFHNKNYKDMLMVLIGLDIEKVWIMPNVINIKKISISKKSKYNKFQIDCNLISEVLIKYYNLIPKIKKIDNKPCDKNRLIEYKFTKFIEDNLKFIDIKYPDIEMISTDIFFFNKKIQIKSSANKRRKMDYNLYKKVKNKRVPYEKGDNDFYLFEIPKKDDFYLIPEIELIKLKIITDNNIIGKKNICLYPYGFGRIKNVKTKNLNKFIFELKNIKKSKDYFINFIKSNGSRI